MSDESVEIRHDVLEAITLERDNAKTGVVKLIEQLDGWAGLLGISDHYWVPPGHPDRKVYAPYFYALNDYGRKNALKESKFNAEGMARIKALEAECDRVRDERNKALRDLESRAADLEDLSAENQRLHSDLVAMTSARDGLRAEIGRMEERADALRAALEKAEDFVVTHAAQGDEQLLGLINAALDGG